MKNNITEYSDEELSLTVMNDYPLYNVVTRRGASPESIADFVSQFFVYTPEQLADLLATVADHHEEDERWLASQGN